MAKDVQERPRSLEVRFTVDEFMGNVFERLSALPPKYRHREALAAVRAYFDGRGGFAPAQAGSAATRIDQQQVAPAHDLRATVRAEGTVRMGRLDQLVATVSQDLLEGPPATTH